MEYRNASFDVDEIIMILKCLSLVWRKLGLSINVIAVLLKFLFDLLKIPVLSHNIGIFYCSFV